MKKRVAAAADRADAWLATFIALDGWRGRTRESRRTLIVELAAALASVNGAVVAACSDDDEAEDGGQPPSESAERAVG